MSVSHQFGGSWTNDKLNALDQYLRAYVKVSKNQPFTTFYVDAFAGTGSRQTRSNTCAEQGRLLFEDETDRQDAQSYQRGSAQVALEIEPPFDHYQFVEVNTEFAAELETLRQRFPQRADRIDIYNEDANAFLVEWSQHLRPLDRAVVFLDPYGMSVNWSTISALAATQKVDLWVLFPLGMAISRVLTRRQPPPPEWAAALTRFFGDTSWEEELYKPSPQLGFFDDEITLIRDADYDAIGRYFIKRLETVFVKVSPKFRTLRNSRNTPLYWLCFAASNPKGAERAIPIADHILGR